MTNKKDLLNTAQGTPLNVLLQPGWEGAWGRMCVLVISHIGLFATPWTVSCQAPLWDSPGKNTGVAMPSFRVSS